MGEGKETITLKEILELHRLYTRSFAQTWYSMAFVSVFTLFLIDNNGTVKKFSYNGLSMDGLEPGVLWTVVSFLLAFLALRFVEICGRIDEIKSSTIPQKLLEQLGPKYENTSPGMSHLVNIMTWPELGSADFIHRYLLRNKFSSPLANQIYLSINLIVISFQSILPVWATIQMTRLTVFKSGNENLILYFAPVVIASLMLLAFVVRMRRINNESVRNQYLSSAFSYTINDEVIKKLEEYQPSSSHTRNLKEEWLATAVKNNGTFNVTSSQIIDVQNLLEPPEKEMIHSIFGSDFSKRLLVKENINYFHGKLEIISSILFISLALPLPLTKLIPQVGYLQLLISCFLIGVSILLGHHFLSKVMTSRKNKV